MNDAARGEDKTIMTLGASFLRLWFGIACTAGLGMVLFWIVFAGRPAMIYQVLFLIMGGLSLYLADRLRRVGQDRIILTDTVLKLQSGPVLTSLDNIDTVERGAFAFKPPNGFLVKLKEPVQPGWAPGLWWKRGKVIGVGGVVPAGQSRAMAELISAKAMGLLPETQTP